MKRKLVPVALGLAFIIASTISAQAAPQGSNLQGEYSLIGTRTCVQNSTINTNFSGPNFSLPNGGTTRTAHFNAILRLFGDGTGDLMSTGIQY
jgi:hypothetical protein